MADNNKIIGGAYIVNDPSPGGLFNNGDGTNPQNYTASRAANLAINEAEKAQGWAIGDTDTDGDSWSETNNSKYWSEQSQSFAEQAAEDLAGVDARIDEANELLDEVQTDLANIDSELLVAEGYSLDAKAWAVGPNPADDLGTPTDTNNAHYWATHVALGHSDAAEAWAAVAQSWATGDTDLDGLDDLGNDTDNAKYWSEQSQGHAVEAETAQTNAETARDTAQSHANSAASSAAVASQEATNAGNSETAAQSAAAAALASQHAAEAAESSAQSDANAANQSAIDAESSHSAAEIAATHAQDSATAAENAATLSEHWARGPNADPSLVPTDTDNAYYWSTQARDNATKVTPEALTDSDEFYYQPVVTDSDEQGVTMAVGIRRRWNADTGLVETEFRSLDRIHRITAGGEHDTYHGVNEQGHDVEARHSWNMDVESDVAQKVLLFSEEHHGISLLEPTDPTVKVDLDDESTHTSYPIYDIDTRLLSNDAIDETHWATRDFVNSEYVDQLTFALLNPDHATYTNNVSVGEDQAYIVQNHNGHTQIFVAEPHDEQKHHAFLKVTDTTVGNYSIYRVKYTDDFHGGTATQFICEAVPIYNSNGTEINEDATTFAIEGSGSSSISVGYGLRHDSESGSIEVDTDTLATWVRDNSNIQVTGTESVVQIQHQFDGSAGTNAVWHMSAGDGIKYGVDVSGQTVTVEVDTEVIADTEWVKAHVGPHSVENLKAGDGITITSNGDTDTIAVDTDVAKLTDIHDSELLAGHGLRYEGQNFSANSDSNRTILVDTDTIADSEWVIEYVASHGGGGSDSTNLTVAPAQTDVVLGSGDTDITFTVSVANGTLVAGSTAATGTDQHSHGITVTKNSDTSFTMSVDRSIAGTATIVVTGKIQDSGGTEHTHTNRARVTVAAQEADWYIGRGTSAPTVAEPAGYTNAGPKANGDLITSPSGTDTLYIIAPASDTEFAFRDEFLTITTTKTANFVTGHDLYTFGEEVEADIPLTIVGG